MTTTSLFESATALRSRSALSVGSRPVRPVVATITISTSGSVTIASIGVSAALPITGVSLSCGTSAQTMRGANSAICAASRSRLRPAESPTTRNSSGSARTTSSVCVPMEPVDPRTTRPFIRLLYSQQHFAVRASCISRTLTLTLSQRARGFTPARERWIRVKFQFSGSIWLFWLHLLLATRLEMRPGWPRLAHRLLVGTVPGWPRLWPRWPHQERPGVAKLLNQLHLVAFRCIPCRCWFGVHPAGGEPHPHPRLLPSREKGFARMRGNDGCFRVNDACNQCKGWGGDGAMGSCRRLGLALGIGAGAGAGMRGSRLRGNDGRLTKSEQLPSVDAACALQDANVLDYLGHLLLGDGRHRRHVAEEPVMLRDALPHGALEGGVSVVARPVDGAYERRALCRSLLRLRRGSPRSSQ